MNAARVLREARARAGLTQAEVARRAGLPQPAVARIERGGGIPRVDTLERLLRACGASLAVEPRLGMDVDRKEIRDLLRLTPSERLAHASAPGFRPAQVLRILVRGRRVRCVAIGGVAALLRGAPAWPSTVEVAPRPDAMNRRRLRLAVQRLGAGRIRYGTVTPRWALRRVGSYELLDRAAEAVPMGDFTVRVASVDDLIRLARTPEEADALGALREELDRR
ncbi:MAG: helix-turn-helix transcriptional regulator [Actinomycetota bacterium]